MLARSVGEGPLAASDVGCSAPTGERVNNVGRALQRDPVLEGSSGDTAGLKHHTRLACGEGSRNGGVEALYELGAALRKCHS